MKLKIALSVAVVAVLLTSGVLAVDHYNKTNNKKAHDAQVVAKTHEDALKALAKERDNYKVIAIQNATECSKGATQYDLLSTVAKKTQVRPACARVL